MIIKNIPLALKINGKRIPLTLNWYRNAHYRELNTAKRHFYVLFVPLFREAKMDLITHFPLKPKWRYHFKDHRVRDAGNYHAVIEKFVLDCLTPERITGNKHKLGLGFLPDDDLTYVIGGDYEGIVKKGLKNNYCEVTL